MTKTEVENAISQNRAQVRRIKAQSYNDQRAARKNADGRCHDIAEEAEKKVKQLNSERNELAAKLAKL